MRGLVKSDPDISKLWTKILAFEVFGVLHSDAFAEKLSEQNRWDRTYIRRLILEYKSFILLAATADHRATPSKPVD